jgi:WYL_2, Sm-like SH3 beta-barrel fold
MTAVPVHITSTPSGAHSWATTAVPHVWETPDGGYAWTNETGACGDDTVYPDIPSAVRAMTVYNFFALEGLGERLRTEVLDVTFKKSDGTLRTMRCTSNPTAFPVREATERVKAPNPDIQVVFDVDKKAIRSFRRDSVVSFVVA